MKSSVHPIGTKASAEPSLLKVFRRTRSTPPFYLRPEFEFASRLRATVRAEIARIDASMDAIKREQHVAFERISQLQRQLDELASLLKKSVDGKRRRTK